MAGRAEARPLHLTLTDLKIGHYITPLRFWRFACRRRGWYGGWCRGGGVWGRCLLVGGGPRCSGGLPGGGGGGAGGRRARHPAGVAGGPCRFARPTRGG